MSEEQHVDPAAYQSAALRTFVAAAHVPVGNLLMSEEWRFVFNYRRPGSPYSSPKVVRQRVRGQISYWEERNAFIANLMMRVLEPGRLDHPTLSNAKDEMHRLFLALTSYFVCYVARMEDSSTVRILFPVDLECHLRSESVCGNGFMLGQEPSEGKGDSENGSCAGCCFRYSFFPWKPVEFLHPCWDEHLITAQFALADASYNAAAPDLDQDRIVPIADIMAPLLFRQSVVFRDLGEGSPIEQYEFEKDGLSLVARRFFSEMNWELGIRGSALLPLPNRRQFAADPQTGVGQYLREYPKSVPFCIEFYSPMPDWFAFEVRGEEIPSQRVSYSLYRDECARIPEPGEFTGTPTPAMAFSSGFDKVGKHLSYILALGFNMQHFGEIKAMEFVEWLRAVLEKGSFDYYGTLLSEAFQKDARWEGLSCEAKHGVEHFVDFLRERPALLASVLGIRHGTLLQPAFKYLIHEPDARTPTYLVTAAKEGKKWSWSKCDFDLQQLEFAGDHTCREPEEETYLESSRCRKLLPLIREILTNHSKHNRDLPLSWHYCYDGYRGTYSFHFLSPNAKLDLGTYLSLRQGQPSLYPSKKDGEFGGLGLSLARIMAETPEPERMRLVIGLNRNPERGPKLTIEDEYQCERYRLGLQTRIYVRRTGL
jgi:hypothetical protein